MVRGLTSRARRLGCAFVLAMVAGPLAAIDIVVVASSAEGRSRVVADAVLQASTPHVLTHGGHADGALETERIRRAALVIALGQDAALAVAAHEDAPPMLVALVSRADFEHLRGHWPIPRMTGLFIDHPVERHLRLIRAVLPEAECTGLVLGPQSRTFEADLAPATESAGLAIEHSFAASAGDVVPALERHLARCASALTLPDAVVSHPHVARAALLTSYRMQRPLFAYSRSWVEAGALAALFSTPATVTRDLLDWIDALESPQRLPEPAHASHFELAMNTRVARALGLQVPDEDTLRAAVTAGRHP
ncbi:ABC transporter substrate-binding protein [Pseudazoarcus pumilus]|uniref:ABC transporter substrate-binding protein n=1 Tax=Pseudazoarcus pumilus TaxID=2067960 RepID=A0A2I6S3L0_9RHOO|nr:ABC transporter substrate binding protein [Pseudazoarcus pumilus]AUN93854.1 hypothetical protein C0099_02200 [Pseudazoarcus pumilus]